MVVFGLVGICLVRSAIDYNTKKAVGLDGALGECHPLLVRPFLTRNRAPIDRVRCVLDQRTTVQPDLRLRLLVGGACEARSRERDRSPPPLTVCAHYDAAHHFAVERAAGSVECSSPRLLVVEEQRSKAGRARLKRSGLDGQDGPRDL